MNIPDITKIGGHEIKTVWCDILKNDEAGDDDPRELLGQANHQFNSIELVKSYEGRELPASRLLATYWHECFHHIVWQAGFAFDESAVDALSESVFQVLRDNDLDFRKVGG